MQRVEWMQEFEIGINVIDTQHKRIVDYINQLVDFDGHAEHDEMAELINALIDYTYSHFAFEEALMEEAGYEFTCVHKRTHQAFTEHVAKLHQRFNQGEDVSAEIGTLLQTWLINHIQDDDQGYAPQVRQQLAVIEKKDSGGWLSNTIKRFFN
jgi:hemerythrin